MTKRKYSEVEMIGALKQMEAGRSAAEVGRELGVSEFRPPLIPRNLLILQDGRNYKNTGFAQVRYTAGTSDFERVTGCEAAAYCELH